MYFGAYKVIENPNLTQSKTIKIEKSFWLKLFETICSWNPCNSDLITPDYKIVHEPSDQVYIVGNTIIAHPNIVKELNKLPRNSIHEKTYGLYNFGA